MGKEAGSTIFMISKGEVQAAPHEAVVQTLEWLAHLAPRSAAVVWRRFGAVWQRLADIGESDDLPCPAQLDAVAGLPAGIGAIALDAAGGADAWFVWRNAAVDDARRIASCLSGHLAAARLADEQSRGRSIQETLLEISQLTGDCRGVDEFFPLVHHLLSRLVVVSDFYIALIEPDSSRIRFPFFRSTHGVPVPDPDRTFPLGEGGQLDLIARLLENESPLLLDRQALSDALAETRPCPAHWAGTRLTDPADNPVGVVVLQRYADQAPFSAADLRWLQYAANHIGHALDHLQYHARLEKQVWLRTCELEGANARLLAEAAERQQSERLQAVLFNIAALANTSLSLNAFLGGVQRQLGELMPARNFQVALYDARSDVIRFPFSVDERGRQTEPHRPGRGLVEQVMHSGCSLLAQPRDNDPDAPVSWLGVPLYCSHELIGVLSVHSYRADESFTFREQSVLEYVANNIATALTRVRLLEDLQRAYAELEERVRERTSELDAVNAQLQFDSMHDPLTRLPNRSYFSKTLRRTWEAYSGGIGERFAVFFIDLDRFKLVNDTLGHLAGDHLLAEAGSRIRNCMRQKDFMARLGGDEFAVLLFGMEQIEDCEVIARRMVNEFERPIILAGREVFTTASVGVVLADLDHHHSAEELLRDADHAMYCTKQQGRHGYTVFNHELRINQADQLAMEAELRRALEESNQLIPYYQPFIDAASGELVGFETLVRWRHPQRGLITPSTFLPIAEESGLIMRVDRYMINAACAQLRRWLDAGRVHDGISLHINLSSANFHDDDLVGWIGRIIETHGLPPSILHLEVTESALIDVPDIAATVMQQLHGLGVRLALDDFGTGYSALSYLHRYRFDVLKIDQSFVYEVDRKEESAAIVRAILALATALSLDVVAEGVETVEQLRHLRAMGCAKLQGFYFSLPVPADQVDWTRLESFRQELSG
jgi:diguanylate cyclase (GGDEF)-like protein